MRNHRKISGFIVAIAIATICIAAGIAQSADIPAESAVIKSGESYSFAGKKAVKDKKAADLLFTAGASYTLKAKRIKNYGAENPKQLTVAEVQGWKDTASGIEAGNYLIVQTGAEKYYLIKVASVKNGETPELSFKWLKFGEAQTDKKTKK